jgi:ComF family protein
MLKTILRICQHAFAAVFPTTCPGCEGVLPATEPLGFCATCYGKLPWWNKAQLLGPQLPGAITSFTAPCLYEEPLRNAILAFKFHDAVPYTKPLAKLLLPYLPPAGPGLLLVPVPSHPSRIRKRRYNHAALLAQQLSKYTSIPCNVTAFKRIRTETPQASKTRAARLKLPASAFHANPTVFRNQHVILIDDIYTTGATAKACALALRKAGASSVRVLTLAYTKPD